MSCVKCVRIYASEEKEGLYCGKCEKSVMGRRWKIPGLVSAPA